MQQTAHKIYCFGDFTLNLTTNALLHKGQEVKLRPKAFDALRYLVENPERLVSKEELLRAVWTDSFVTDDSLVKCLKDVRRALEDDAQQFVKTVPRRGYIFVAKVSEQGHADANVVYAEQVEAIRVVIKEGQHDEEGQEEIQAAAVADSLSAISRTDRPHLKINRKTLLATALLLVLATGLIYLWIVRKRPQPPPVAMVKSMAVLPFRPLGEQNRNEILEVGLADSLITKLSKIKQLTVRPLSAVLKYAGGEQDAVTIGRALLVEAVLESRVQQVGDRLKINSQLVRVEDGKVIWSFQCDDLCVDILTLQDSVSESIARQLRFNLTSEEQKLLTRRYTDNTEVYQLYLNGRAELPKGTREGTEKAIDYFQQALTREPNYAPAYSGLADCYIMLGIRYSPPRGVFPKAKYTAERAIAIDDTLAEAHASLGVVLLVYEWDFVDAKREFERAIELDPNYARTHQKYADYLTAIGHHEEAIREAGLACELDPTSPGRRSLLGRQLYFARQYDQAIEEEKKAQELGAGPFGYRVSALIELGRYEEAVEYDLQIRATVGVKPEKLEELRATFQAGGIRDFWRKEIEQLTKAPRQDNNILGYLAYDYAYLGEKDKAFACLEKMFAERDGYLFYLQVDPRYDNLRSDPRYADLVRRIGFPQA